MPDRPTSATDDRVVSFPAAGRPSRQPASPVGDLTAFERDAEPDDYRHRMITNLLALVVVTLLVTAGLWLADSLATMRKNQDCVLSGKRGCTPVEVPVNTRY